MRLFIALFVLFGISTVTFSEAYAQDLTLQGTAKVNSCSASVVKLRHSQVTDKALLLTNGHCINVGSFKYYHLSMPAPGEVIVNQVNKVPVYVKNANGDTQYTARTTRILYGTMTDTDMAIYELEETYEQLTKNGVEARVLADKAPEIGEPITVISGYWNKTFSCSIEATIPSVIEQPWTWLNSVRYSTPGCEIYGGTSGSPVVSGVSGEVIAVNNTANESGELCTIMNPCEVDSNGQKSIIKGRGYAQQTYQFYGCLSAMNEVDLTLGTCELPKPKL